MKRFSLTIILAILIALAVSPAAAQGNLLRDPSFETTSYRFVSSDPLDPYVTFNAPADWNAFFLQSPREASWMNVHPTGYPHSGSIIHSGGRSYHIARGGGTFTAVVYQQVSVVQGSTVQGGAWAFLEAQYGSVRVGIDPNGGTNVAEGDIIWSPFSSLANSWQQVSVTATATGNVVTLFLYAMQSLPSDPNGVYWDDAFLNGAAGSVPVTTSSGAAATTYITPNVQVNVRSGPGTQNPRIGRINPGEVYQVISLNNGWYAINFNGQTGYVSANLVTITNGQSTTTSAPVTGNAFRAAFSNVRVRGGPGTTFAIVTRIPYRSVAQIIGRNADSSWLQVTYNGVTGWALRTLGEITGDLNSLPVTG